MEKNYAKKTKGYYVVFDHMCYGAGFSNLLEDPKPKPDYSTWEEADKRPDEILDNLETTYYTDGEGNFYFCKCTGHGYYRNEHIINRLVNKEPCLYKGYFVISKKSFNEKFYENTYKGINYCYFGSSGPYDTLEEVIKEHKIKISEDGEYYYNINRYLGNVEKELELVEEEYPLVLCYLNEDKTVEIIYPNKEKEKPKQITK